MNLTPTNAVQDRIGVLLSADASTLAPASDANIVALVKAPFVPSAGLIASDLTLADFDGADPIAGETGAQENGIDPADGSQVVTNIEPAGGWRWETTGATNLPQTIYGVALLNEAGTTLLGSALLEAPLTLSAAGQFIDLGSLAIRISPTPFTTV